MTLATAHDPEAASMRYRKRIIIVESTLMASQQAQRAIDWGDEPPIWPFRQLTVTIDSGAINPGNYGSRIRLSVNIPSLQLPDTGAYRRGDLYQRQ